MAEWRKLPITLAELCIDTVLRCGQSFRWQKIDDTWMCTLRGRVVALRQDPAHLYYRVTWPDKGDIPAAADTTSSSTADDTEALLRHYFALHLDLPALYRQWGDADANFRRRAPAFGGVRMLSQDAWEALVCFICSSNNHISRISSMVHKLCDNYGPYVATIGDRRFYDFPTPAALAAPGVEPCLRTLGFGYRARYIAETARIVAEQRPVGWLHRLRNPAHPAFGATPDEIDAKATYRGAHDALVQLTGVGAKVADCVCLMGLGWGGAIPVDTHVWQIAQRDYKYGARGKTLNKAMYDGIGDLFRGLWGEYAGWAHSVLFTADLKSFSGQGKVAIKQEGEGVKVELKEEEGLAQAATSAKKKRRGATLEVTQIKQEVEEADLVQLKVDADLERPAQAARTTRKRTRTDITAEVVDAKREGAEPASVGGEDGEFHRSISETVGKRRRTRVNYKE